MANSLGEAGSAFAVRDHHPFAFSTWLAGGGVQGGQVIGRTDDFGWSSAEDPVHINDFHATLLRLFGFDHKSSRSVSPASTCG